MSSKQLWSWAPAVVWTAITFVMSHQPAVTIPFGAPDYVAHAMNYAVLGVLLIWARAGGEWPVMTMPLMVSAVVIAVLLGIFDEFHQSFIPGRDSSAKDVLADAVGACIGVCVVAAVVALRGARARPT
ncbi:MAG TPA: VanZ family protein [Vicinamibacterales bacterium]|nr:VanZ family protein [Vicinamibacterales bacterium]